jgi:hypothetical protein
MMRNAEGGTMSDELPAEFRHSSFSVPRSSFLPILSILSIHVNFSFPNSVD